MESITAPVMVSHTLESEPIIKEISSRLSILLGIHYLEIMGLFSKAVKGYSNTIELNLSSSTQLSIERRCELAKAKGMCDCFFYAKPYVFDLNTYKQDMIDRQQGTFIFDIISSVVEYTRIFLQDRIELLRVIQTHVIPGQKALEESGAILLDSAEEQRPPVQFCHSSEQRDLGNIKTEVLAFTEQASSIERVLSKLRKGKSAALDSIDAKEKVTQIHDTILCYHGWLDVLMSMIKNDSIMKIPLIPTEWKDVLKRYCEKAPRLVEILQKEHFEIQDFKRVECVFQMAHFTEERLEGIESGLYILQHKMMEMNLRYFRRIRDLIANSELDKLVAPSSSD